MILSNADFNTYFNTAQICANNISVATRIRDIATHNGGNIQSLLDRLYRWINAAHLCGLDWYPAAGGTAPGIAFYRAGLRDLGAHAATKHSIRAYISLTGQTIHITYRDLAGNNIPVDLANFNAFDNYAAINHPQLGGALGQLMLAPLARQGQGGPYWPTNYNVPLALSCNGQGPQNGNGDAVNPQPNADGGEQGNNAGVGGGGGVTHPLNFILYGPPGTGKTFATVGLALNFCGSAAAGVSDYATECLKQEYAPPPDLTNWKTWLTAFETLRSQGRIEFTTFHQNYAYEDFVEGIRAQANNGQVNYAIEPGIFKRIAYRALYAWLTGQPCPVDAKGEDDARAQVDDWLGRQASSEIDTNVPPSYVLIIDEINRGNIARILGELITLLEDSKRARRQGEIALGHQPLTVTLPYTRKPFIVPPNLYIIGTMNTADRSLIGLDVALRRRFNFVELPPRPEALPENVDGINLNEFLETLNQRIERHLDANHTIGHAFFVGVGDIIQVRNLMVQKVIPLLREYFHDRPEALRSVLQIETNKFFGLFAEKGRGFRFICVDHGALSNPGNYNSFITFKD